MEAKNDDKHHRPCRKGGEDPEEGEEGGRGVASSFLRGQDDLKLIPPDGGWGWLVAFGGCLIHTLSVGVTVSFSLIFASFFAENGTSSTTVAWIFNTNQCVWNTTSFFAGPLCAMFTWRKVAFCGGLFLSFSIILSGFVSKPEYLFFTFSIVAGMGQGLSVLISYVIVAHYFDKKKGLATGIVSVGNCFGQFLGPLLARCLIEHYPRQGTTLIFGGILLHSSLAALLFQPVEWHSATQNATDGRRSPVLPRRSKVSFNPQTNRDSNASENGGPGKSRVSKLRQTFWSKKPKRTQEDLTGVSCCFEENDAYEKEGLTKGYAPKTKSKMKIFQLVMNNLGQLRWHRVQIITLTLALVMSGYINFLMLVPFAMTEKGHSLEIVSWCLSVAGLCNIVSRITVPALTDLVSVSSRYFFMVGSFGIFVSCVMFTFVSSTKMLLVTMSLFGLSVGSCMCLLSIVVLEFVGLEFLPSVLGLDGLMVATFFLIVGPVAGAVRDVTQSYSLTIQMLSGTSLLSFCLWFLMPCAVSLDKRRISLMEEKERQEEV